MANTSLDSLLQAFHNAVLQAQRLTEEQHIAQLSQYFDWSDGADEKLTGIPRLLSSKGGAPRSLTMKVPSLQSNAKDAVETIKVPLLTLIPPTALKIKNVVVEFEVGLNEIDSESQKSLSAVEEGLTGRKSISVDLGGGGLFGKKANRAKVRLEFEAGEPSESFQRVNDHLIKTIV